MSKRKLSARAGSSGRPDSPPLELDPSKHFELDRFVIRLTDESTIDDVSRVLFALDSAPARGWLETLPKGEALKMEQAPAAVRAYCKLLQPGADTHLIVYALCRQAIVNSELFSPGNFHYETRETTLFSRYALGALVNLLEVAEFCQNERVLKLLTSADLFSETNKITVITGEERKNWDEDLAAWMHSDIEYGYDEYAPNFRHYVAQSWESPIPEYGAPDVIEFDVRYEAVLSLFNIKDEEYAAKIPEALNYFGDSYEEHDRHRITFAWCEKSTIGRWLGLRTSNSVHQQACAHQLLSVLAKADSSFFVKWSFLRDSFLDLHFDTKRLALDMERMATNIEVSLKDCEFEAQLKTMLHAIAVSLAEQLVESRVRKLENPPQYPVWDV